MVFCPTLIMGETGDSGLSPGLIAMAKHRDISGFERGNYGFIL